jgi:hypothetical protein
LSAKRSAPGQHNRTSLFLVDLPTARDLLLRAKYLFVAAIDGLGFAGACVESANQNMTAGPGSEQVQFLRDQQSKAPDAETPRQKAMG